MPDVLVVYGGANPPGRLRAALDGAIRRARKRELEVVVLDLGERPVTPESLVAIASARAVVFAGRFESGRLIGPLGELLARLPSSSLAGKPTAAVALHDARPRPTHLGRGPAAVPIDVHLTAADFADGVAAPAASRTLDALLDSLATRANAPAAA